MFNNAGSKVKTVAAVLFALFLIGAVLGGFASCRIVSDASGQKISLLGFLTFVGITVVVGLCAWVSCIMLSAFGEMVENTAEAVKKQERIDRKLDWLIRERNAASADSPKTEASKKDAAVNNAPTPDEMVLCPGCKRLNPRTNRNCSKCGTYLPLSLTPIQDKEEDQKPVTPVIHNKVCPKCKKENPSDYLFCQYCGQRIK